jgi:hypothetical protein
MLVWVHEQFRESAIARRQTRVKSPRTPRPAAIFVEFIFSEQISAAHFVGSGNSLGSFTHSSKTRNGLHYAARIRGLGARYRLPYFSGCFRKNIKHDVHADR